MVTAIISFAKDGGNIHTPVETSNLRESYSPITSLIAPHLERKRKTQKCDCTDVDGYTSHG